MSNTIEQLGKLELLTMAQVTKIVGVCPTTIRKWEADGLFPKAIRNGRRYTRWRAPHVLQWLKEKGLKL